MSKPILWIVIPCYNEEKVLPITAPMFLQKIKTLAEKEMVSDKSRVLFVNDGSKDATWELICKFAQEDEHFIGISQSRNRGHQNAVLAGLMEAKENGCDITISIDCDGQDDIDAMDEMVQKYLDGAEVVYGVRSRHRHLLQAVHRRGLLPPDERAGRGHRVQPRRLPPDQCPRAGELCRLQRSQHLPARHGAAGGFPQRNGQLRAPRAPRRREPLPLEQDAGAGL